MSIRKETIERIYLTRDEFKKIESEIRFHEHLRRYAAIRRFCYGKVLDFAYGSGYGSFMLGENPEVEKVVGVDKDSEAIAWAKQEYSHPKVEYLDEDINHIHQDFDTLVCLETIEHFENDTIIQNLVKRCNIKNLIFSFPDKKSTHFNPFHVRDIILQDVADILSSHLIYHSFRIGDVQFVLMMQLPKNAPHHIFRNIRDL